MKDIFQERNMNYSLRHGKDAQVPKVRATSFGIETITYFGSRLRQLLPQEIKIKLRNYCRNKKPDEGT